MSELVRPFAAILLVSSLLGCETPVGVDEPCETTEDCEDGLECDLHDGEGTCQEVHDD